MLFQVKTGAFEVIDSGVLHVIEDEVTILRLGDVSFSLIFEKNDDGKQAVAFEASDKKNAKLILTNVQGPLGYGTTKPFQVGDRDGKGLFLTFVTRSLNDTYLRTFEYTLYTK